MNTMLESYEIQMSQPLFVFIPSFDQTTNITDLYKLFYLAGIKKVKATKKKKV